MPTTKTIQVTLTTDQGSRLEALAKRAGTTPNHLIEEAIAAYLEDLDDKEWASQVIAEWEASDKQTRPIAELWAELGLEVHDSF